MEDHPNDDTFTSANFEELVRGGRYLKMPVKDLLHLLEKDDLLILENGFCLTKKQQEVKVLEAISNYIKANPGLSDQLPQLLSRGVRLLLLPSEEELKSNPLITPTCLKQLNQLLSSDLSEQDQERWKEPRLCAIEYEKTKELAGTKALRSEEPSKPFDDSKLFHGEQCVYVTGMEIHIRRWDGRAVVGGIKVFYSNGETVLHASADYGCENHEFHLEPGERIVSINARSGWMIDQLQFLTSRGKEIGPFGGPGGAKHRLVGPCDGAYLAYLTGTVDVTYNETAVRNIRFVWGYHKRPS